MIPCFPHQSEAVQQLPVKYISVISFFDGQGLIEKYVATMEGHELHSSHYMHVQICSD